MFGAFRFSLAAMVVYNHLINPTFAGPVAVFGFYCLSGYLMTRVINETYADGAPGFLRYIANRALRLYPTYYAALALAIAADLLWPVTAASLLHRVALPSALLPDLTILVMQSRFELLLPQTWSLNVEILHYILIGALLGRSRRATVLWFVCAALIPSLAILFVRPPVEWLYFSAPATSIAFATGAMIWHFHNRLNGIGPWLGLAAACVFILAGLVMPEHIGLRGGLFAALPIGALAVGGLKNLPPKSWDSYLGDLAYPAFLLHIPAAIFARSLLDDQQEWILSITFTMGASWLALVFIEKPLQVFRATLRHRPLSASMPAA